MRTVSPDTRVRCSIAELGSLDFGGATPALTCMSDGSTIESLDDVERVPELVKAEWKVKKAKVSAFIEVVASSYCTPKDVLAYRKDDYRLESYGYDEESPEVAQAIQDASDVIEREAHRCMQPVVRLGFVDRANCMTRSLVMSEGGYDPDTSAILSATADDGSEADVKLVKAGPYVDTSRMRIGSSAEVVYETGIRPTPSEMKAAVTAFAAWSLVPRSEPENATTTSTEAGVLSFVIGGVDGAATSLPEVNALIDRYGRAAYKLV